MILVFYYILWGFFQYLFSPAVKKKYLELIPIILFISVTAKWDTSFVFTFTEWTLFMCTEHSNKK